MGNRLRVGMNREGGVRRPLDRKEGYPRGKRILLPGLRTDSEAEKGFVVAALEAI